jgi:hypothetical protein
MRIIAAMDRFGATRKILDCIGLQSRPAALAEIKEQGQGKVWTC